MKNIFTDIDLVIFDLDGTLYEDTEHFQYYAELLKKQLNNDVQERFMHEYEKMVAGNHIVSIGKVYDVLRDYILKIDMDFSNVLSAWTWDGQPLEIEEIKKIYQTPIQLDFDTMIAIGDGWWLPNVCARHFGVKETQEAYVKTKEYMDTTAFHLTKIPGLREGLKHLKEKKDIVLVTNSEKNDVNRILRNLDLEDIFVHIISEAKKPQYTKNHFVQLLKKFSVNPKSAMSIGDNYINEIAPAVNLGMKTVFIDFYDLDYPEYRGVKVRSISEIIEQMTHVD